MSRIQTISRRERFVFVHTREDKLLRGLEKVVPVRNNVKIQRNVKVIASQQISRSWWRLLLVFTPVKKRWTSFKQDFWDFLPAKRNQDNVKDLIKDYVQFHIDEEKVDNILEGFEYYKSESLLNMSPKFQLAISSSFFRTGLDDGSDCTTISLNEYVIV